MKTNNAIVNWSNNSFWRFSNTICLS